MTEQRNDAGFLAPLSNAQSFEALRRLHDVMMVEEKWTDWEATGFSWWPGRLRQRLHIEEVDWRGYQARRLVAETDLYSGSPGAAALEGFCELSRFPPLSHFVVDQDAKRTALRAHLLLAEAWEAEMVARFSVVAILQATFAELGGEGLASRFGLALATSQHPESGEREHPDGLLSLAAAEIVPAGRDGSAWNTPEVFEEVSEILVDADARVTSTRAGLLSARLPSPEPGGDRYAPRSSALLQIQFEANHPELANGACLRLFLPHHLTEAAGSPALTALTLNSREIEGVDAPAFGFGAWCLEHSIPEVIEFAVKPSPARLCHVVFIPNYLHGESILPLLLEDEILRSAWALDVLGETRK